MKHVNNTLLNKGGKKALYVLNADMKKRGISKIESFSIAKAVISCYKGIHRRVSEKHLKSYLSEVCYRFNQRFWEKELFNRLVQACILTDTLTYKELIHKNKTLS